MGKISQTGSVANLNTLEDVKRFANQLFQNIITQINGRLTFSDNINAKVVDVSFDAANTVKIVPHGLDRVPLMWISGSVSVNAVIFQSRPADANNVYLEASAVCDAKILVI